MQIECIIINKCVGLTFLSFKYFLPSLFLYMRKIQQQKQQQNFSLQQFGLNSGRASIASCTSLPPTQVFTTIGIFKGERVAIKKVAKKKVGINAYTHATCTHHTHTPPTHHTHTISKVNKRKIVRCIFYTYF
jgi:hypothetical protein